MTVHDLPGKILNRLRERRAKRFVRRSLTRVHGPALTRLADDEVALVLLGRDVGYFLDHHIRHHLALGVSHVVYVDNGSSDDSVEIASRFSNVTVATCAANFREHQSRIRFLANTLFLKGGWRLAIDPDELLDYPGADRIALPELTRRMAARGHTAMVAQMLDMVPAGTLSQAGNMGFEEVERVFERFSLNNITALPYHGSDLTWRWYFEQNRISNPEIRILFGGIRNAIFGENCCLTKHALFRMDKGVVPMASPHVSTGLSCTDFSAVLRHYKFAGNMLERESKIVAENRVAHGETKLRVEKLRREGDIDLGAHAEHADASVEHLLELGFLKASDAALRMLA